MIPAYIQIHDQIKSEIDQKIWKIGERLPSERDLAEKFQVSRMTLRQAITLLVEEGVLERRVGSWHLYHQHARPRKNARHNQFYRNYEIARQGTF